MLRKKSLKSKYIAVSRHTLQMEARSRSYTVVLPKVPQKSAPLLFVFHGSNQTGEKMRAFSGNVFDELVQEHGFVVVYPDGYKGHWNDARVSSTRTVKPSAKDSLRVLGGEGGKVLMCFILSVGSSYIVSSHMRDSSDSLCIAQTSNIE